MDQRAANAFRTPTTATMSSLRNSLHRRNHKERGQLVNRKRLGLLEKHKDYVQRAKDFNAKKEKIKRLKEKVADRNKDEFYFGMVNKKTQGGQHFQDRGNAALPVDIVKVLKSQDEGYLRTTRTTNLKRIDALKAQISNILSFHDREDDEYLELVDEYADVLEKCGLMVRPQRRRAPTNHIVFVDNEAEARNYIPPQIAENSVESFVKTSPQDLGWKTTENSKKPAVIPRADVAMSDSPTVLEQLLPELKARLERETHILYALRELEMQRALMGKGASKKIRGPERIESADDRDDEMDEDERDAMIAKRIKEKPKSAPELSAYKPRVYKFRAERKR